MICVFGGKETYKTRFFLWTNTKTPRGRQESNQMQKHQLCNHKKAPRKVSRIWACSFLKACIIRLPN
jgi:hypothetical protein